MLYATFKVILTSVLVVAVSEAAKRSTLVGAIIASVPLVSVLAMIWLQVDASDTEKLARLATGIGAPFAPALLESAAVAPRRRHFHASIAASLALTVGAYFAMLYGLRFAGIEI